MSKQPFSTIQLLEFFHLAFLTVLQVRLNQSQYILKGGSNLRYFYGSPRYSEDIDFDAVMVTPDHVEARVDRVLESRALKLILDTHQISIVRYSKPKQTATTQRWKIAISVRGRGDSMPTKLEFSHRPADERAVLEQVPPAICVAYALRPPTVRRYLPPAAIEQKVGALATRRETQARDVFDLDLLFRQWPTEVKPGQLDRGLLDVAIDRVLDLPLEAYVNQVLRFLDADIVELYDRPGAWDDIRAHVSERLAALK